MSYDNHQISGSLQCHLEERDPSLSLKGHWCPSGLLRVHAGGGPGKRVFLTVLCESYDVLLHLLHKSCISCTMLFVFLKMCNVLYNALFQEFFKELTTDSFHLESLFDSSKELWGERFLGPFSACGRISLYMTDPKVKSKEYHDFIQKFVCTSVWISSKLDKQELPTFGDKLTVLDLTWNKLWVSIFNCSKQKFGLSMKFFLITRCHISQKRTFRFWISPEHLWKLFG